MPPTFGLSKIALQLGLSILVLFQVASGGQVPTCPPQVAQAIQSSGSGGSGGGPGGPGGSGGPGGPGWPSGPGWQDEPGWPSGPGWQDRQKALRTLVAKKNTRSSGEEDIVCKKPSDCPSAQGCVTYECIYSGVKISVQFCWECTKKTPELEANGYSFEGCGSGNLKVFDMVVLLAFVITSRFLVFFQSQQN